MLRYGTVCSGIGAPEVAARGLDWQCSFMSEIEKFPRAVLTERFPTHPLHGDFTTIKGGNYANVDVLIGGTPCQDFSVAGKRLGLDAPRGNLALEYLALARRLGTRWLVWENVPGMLSSWSDDTEGFAGINDHGEGRDIPQRNDFDTFLNFVGECGYGWAWRVLDGQHFGVPQRRRRIILVGHIGDWRPATAVLFERESLRRDITPRREARKGIACRADAGVAVGGEPVAHPLRAQHNHSFREDSDTLVTHTLRGDGFDASEDGSGRGTPLVPEMLGGGAVPNLSYCLNAGGMKRIDAESETLVPTGGFFDVQPVAGTITADTHPGAYTGQDAHNDRLIPVAVFDPNQITSKSNRSQPTPDLCHTLPAESNAPVAFESRFVRNGRGAPSDLVPPLKAQSGDTGKGDAAPLVAGIGHNGGPEMRVRRLTPTECERLMDFEDGWTAITYNGKPAADGPRYKSLGNSMIVGKMRWVLCRLDRVDKIVGEVHGKNR